MKKVTFLSFLICCISMVSFSQQNLLYLKRGEPANWSIEGGSGSQYKEMLEWQNAGYTITKMNLAETTITADLLDDYDAFRFNGYGGGGRATFTADEGMAIYNWVMAGGKCLATDCWSRFNPLFTSFGILEVSQHDNWTGFPYHGAPFNISPVTGPIGQIDVFAIEAMDQPDLASNHTLTIDADVSGYPAVMHGEFGAGKIVFTLTEGWSHDETYPGNAFRSDIYEGDNLEFLDNVLTYISSSYNDFNLLYLKRGEPANWSIEGGSGSQYKEMLEWQNAGYTITKMNLAETTITADLLDDYDAFRFNGYGGGGRATFTADEGMAIYNWVMAGGKCLATDCWSRFNPLFTSFGILEVSQHDNWTGFPYHGAPFNISPVTGPIGQIDVFAIEAMDQPDLASNHTLTIDADVSGYPAVMHGEFGAGKIVFTLTEGWSHDETYPGNAFRSDIYKGDNLEFLDNVIVYFETSTAIDNDPDHNPFEFSVYPNPAREKVCFETEASGICQIIDLTGRLVHSSEIYGGKNIISLTNLQSGYYLIGITDDQNKSFKKLLIN